jgi:2-polyprenyl-3-methyl-5-hydroxy-6-metoxy-1,4-benzoquinol methylase
MSPLAGRTNRAVSTSQTATADSQYALSGIPAATDLFNLRTVNRDAALVVQHLRPGMRVVDFGCGAGSLTCGFAELVAPGEVLGFDMSEDAIVRAKALAEQSALRNVQFSVGNVNDLDLPGESFDVAHFSGVLMYLKEPERALQLAFRCLKSGGMLAAREAQKAGDWFAGPYAESIAAYFKIAVAGHRMRGGDPFLGARLPALAREAGFVKLEATPSYSAGLSNVRATGTAMLSTLGRAEFRAAALECGIFAEGFDRLAHDISSWVESQDSIAAFAECTVLAWKS